MFKTNNVKERKVYSKAWRCIPLIPLLQRQMDLCEFEDLLVYIVSSGYVERPRLKRGRGVVFVALIFRDFSPVSLSFCSVAFALVLWCGRIL